MNYSQGDIVLADAGIPNEEVNPHPFLIISSDDVHQYEDGYIMVMITSSLKNDELSYSLTPDKVTSQLRKPSEIRCHIIAFVEEINVIKPLSKIKRDPLNEVLNKIVDEVFGFVES